MTSVSLFASATRFPRESAASVASSPAAPTTALSTMSTSSRAAASTRHSGPTLQSGVRLDAVAARYRRSSGENRAACSPSSCSVVECRQRGDAKAVALPLEHAQRRRADRPGRSENGDAAALVASVTAPTSA